MRPVVALGAFLLLAACGGTGSGVIVERSALGIDSPVPTAASEVPDSTGPTTTTTEAVAPTEPGEDLVLDEAALRDNLSFRYSVDRQQRLMASGYRAVYVGRFSGADRTVAVVASGSRFRVDFEGESWVYDGGVAADGALRCSDGSCERLEEEPPVAAVEQPLQPLVAPWLMPDAVLRTVQAGGSATLSYRTDGPEPASCAAVEQFDTFIGFQYCVSPAGVVTSFEQGSDYRVELAEWTAGATDADFVPPFPIR